MKNKFKKILFAAAASLFALTAIPPVSAFADSEPTVTARYAILYDVQSGKVLYERDSQSRLYPASMTKIVTALVMLDYFALNDYFVCGDEVVNNVPAGSSTSGNEEGETLIVENALRLLVIPSGNETACAVARATAKKVLGDPSISYNEAERWFCGEMNKKAKELGALDTNFVNPHGFHDSRHYTTAYDLAVISAAAMEIEAFKRIAGEISFSGNGAGETPPTNAAKTKNYSWSTHNELIKPTSQYYYPYATGIKTGYHNEAGYCVAASATKGDRELIAIIALSTELERNTDASKLFDYGFDNFALEDIQAGDTELGELPLSNPMLGASETIRYMALGGKSDLLSKDQISRIVREEVFLPEVIADPVVDEVTGKIDSTQRIKTPVTQGQILGSVNYTLDGELIFQSDLVSLDDALERSFNSDVDYYLEVWKKRATSPMAIPVYAGIVVLLFLIIKISSSMRKRRSRSAYRLRRRY